MKFCKQLQRIVEEADPSWAPYWINYKSLKKLLNALVPRRGRGNTYIPISRLRKGPLASSPCEIQFFKRLYAEIKKADHFLTHIQEEMQLRTQRLRESCAIVHTKTNTKLSPPKMASEKSIGTDEEGKFCEALLAKGAHRLYQDLLLLETYCMVSLSAVSKILKKHDKLTGRSTRQSFLESILSQASFYNYPTLRGLMGTVSNMKQSIDDLFTPATLMGVPLVAKKTDHSPILTANPTKSAKKGAESSKQNFSPDGELFLEVVRAFSDEMKAGKQEKIGPESAVVSIYNECSGSSNEEINQVEDESGHKKPCKK